jgi:hypothetical protein
MQAPDEDVTHLYRTPVPDSTKALHLPSALLVLENIFCRWMLTDHSHDKTLALTDYGRTVALQAG